MKRKIFVILILFIFCSIVYLVESQKNKNININPLVFYDKQSFFNGISESEKNKQFPAHKISGGIVTHHLFASFIISDFFQKLSLQKPETVVLIGPNHFEKGNSKILSSLYSWDTPFGIVHPNEQVINDLVDKKTLQIENQVLAEDHAVAVLMPYVKYYLPDTKVVPILLSGFLGLEEIQKLSDELSHKIDDNTVVISAVDFSHYLMSKEASENDQLTLQLMKNREYSQILSLDNNYLDSAPSIIVLLMLMQSGNTTQMDLLHNTNSGEMQRNNTIETTSYFSIMYY